MRTLSVSRRINAPARQIFELLADHAGYASFPGIDSAAIVRPGASADDDTGLQREIRVGRLTFLEEITAFDPPRRLAYRIVRCTLPMEHELAVIDLEENGAWTRVQWQSCFRMTVPLLGGVLGYFLEREVSRGYAATLKAIDRRLTSA